MRSTIAVCRSSALAKRCCCVTFLLLNAFAARALSAQTTDDPSPTRQNIPLPRLNLTAVEPRRANIQTRWERFNAEFGIRDQHTSFLTASLLRAKYTADVALFSIKTISSTLGDATELHYSRGRIRRASTDDSVQSPSTARQGGLITLEGARLRFDFELARSKPYVGVRLVLPFGD